MGSSLLMSSFFMENLKFSIVVPVYNREKTIENAIKSIEDQDYENIEIIAIDDGSSDDSYGKLHELQTKSPLKESFIVHRHEEIIDLPTEKNPRKIVPHNRGTNIALNSGFNLATGDIIGILDSDDMLAPMTVTSLVRAYNEEPLLDVCWTLYEAFDPGWKYPRMGSRCSWPAPISQKEVIIQNLIRFSCFHFLTVRASSYRYKFATFENMPKTSVDYAWILENMFRGEFRRLNHVGYYYMTKTPGSHSSDGKKEQQRIATICRMNAMNYAHTKGFINDDELADIKQRCAELKEEYLEKKREKEEKIAKGEKTGDLIE